MTNDIISSTCWIIVTIKRTFFYLVFIWLFLIISVQIKEGSEKKIQISSKYKLPLELTSIMLFKKSETNIKSPTEQNALLKRVAYAFIVRLKCLLAQYQDTSLPKQCIKNCN